MRFIYFQKKPALLKTSLSKKGFSFVEVMYSVLILTSMIVILAGMSSQASRHLKRSERYHTVSDLMEERFAALEMEFQKEGESVIEEQGPNPFENHPGFSWSLKSQPAPIWDIIFKRPEGGASIMENLLKQMIPLLGPLVREVRLTIHFKGKGGGQADYSAVSYFIDFKKIHSAEFLLNLQNVGKSLSQGLLGE